MMKLEIWLDRENGIARDSLELLVCAFLLREFTLVCGVHGWLKVSG